MKIFACRVRLLVRDNDTGVPRLLGLHRRGVDKHQQNQKGWRHDLLY